ncbi:MAG: GNAT family N-acetyltransferase [Flavobacteriaceae bacterium]
MHREFYISTEKNKLDIPQIHHQIKHSYWGDYRTMELTKNTIENSMCFGVYSKTGVQVGFARVLTDHVVLAYIMDVIIFDQNKGQGLGKMLINHILDHPILKNVQTIALKTKDAHGLYESYGFKSIGNSPMWMAKDIAK